MVSIVGQVCGIYKNINKFRIRVYHIHGCPDAYIAVHPELNDKYHVADKDLPVLPYDYGLDSVCKLGDFVHLICPTGHFDHSTRVIGKVWDLSELSPELQGMATDVSAPVIEEIIERESQEPQTCITGEQSTEVNNTTSYANYFGYPLKYQAAVTSPWAENVFHTSPHKGIDLGIAVGTPIYSAGDGVVKEVYTGFPVNEDYSTPQVTTNGMESYGNYVTIAHGFINGEYFYTHYAHLKATCVNVGDVVKGTQLVNGSKQEGTKIGEADNTGCSYGPHLHFEIIISDSSYVDRSFAATRNPANYIQF